MSIRWLWSLGATLVLADVGRAEQAVRVRYYEGAGQGAVAEHEACPEHESGKQRDHRVPLVLRAEDPVQRPEDRAAERQADAHWILEAQAHEVTPSGDDDDAGVADERRGHVQRPELVAEQGYGQKRQRDRPGVVERLGFLGGQPVVRFEQHQVVRARVERAEDGRTKRVRFQAPDGV